jgi:ABC-type polysaccharide transport system permease subunit
VHLVVLAAVVMEGLFIVRIFKSYNNIMLTTPSKVVWIVAAAYLTTFFALASGVINALIEGRGVNRFMIPSRSAQTVGETVVVTLILFMGMAGAFMLYQSGRSANPKVQKALLIAGFGLLGIALLLGFILVGVKL